ncbi:MAG: SDR family oxidoreductase [Planctomycetes bacterium]|nr:SDR family oxidoreductase [Planctomycetota bacterium]
MTAKPGSVLITGARTGIGLAIARRLANEGWNLHLTARRRESLDDLANELASTGAHVTTHALDLLDDGSIDSLVDALAHKTLDAVVNNAGEAASAPFLKTTDELLRRLLQMHVVGPFRLTRALLPGFLERERGFVLNVASIAAKVGAPYIAAYAAAKHGLLGWTRSLALEVAARNVRVHAICPGYVDTPMTTETIQNIVAKTGRTPEQALAGLTRSHPHGRLVDPREIAALAAFLLRDEAPSLHGQALVLDGGAIAF